MNIEKLNHLLNFLASIGVIIGIYFLVAELNQANRIAEGEARDRNTAAEFQLAEVISANDRLLELSVKLKQPDPQLDAIEKELAAKLTMLYVSNWGKLVVQNSTGLLPESSLRFAKSGIAATFTDYPGLAAFVADYAESRGISRDTSNPIWRTVWDEITAQ